MKIAIATDHNGVNEKKEIIRLLKNYNIIDYSEENNPTDDYPDFAFKLAEDVAANKINLGVLMCGTGIGMSIAANKVKGVRCAHCSNIQEAHLAREHNNANIIALSYKNDINLISEMIEEFLATTPSKEERHCRRVQKIINYENGVTNEL